jgi:hypothetical protein
VGLTSLIEKPPRGLRPVARSHPGTDPLDGDTLSIGVSDNRA